MIAVLRSYPGMGYRSSFSMRTSDRYSHDTVTMFNNFKESVCAVELLSDQELLPSVKRQLRDMCEVVADP
jgi:hypothetical protein